MPGSGCRSLACLSAERKVPHVTREGRRWKGDVESVVWYTYANLTQRKIEIEIEIERQKEKEIDR